jgi:exosortase
MSIAAPIPLAQPSPPRREAFRRPSRPVLAGRLTAWRVVLSAGLLALGVWVCRDAWVEIFDYARRNEEYSQIFLAVPVAALLVYVRKLRLRHFRVAHTWLGPVMVLGGLLWNAFGYEHDVQVLFHAGAVLAAVGCVVSVLGKNALFRFLPAAVVLGFLVPVPGGVRAEIAVALQHWIANTSHVILDLFGADTTVSGNLVRVNGQAVRVDEACNGMRLLFPLILIAFAFAYGLPLRNWVRLLLLLASPLVAIVCNVIRTVPTMWLYGYADRRLADVVHDAGGWLMLPLAALVLLAIVRLLRWAMIPVQRYTLASAG